MRQYLPLDFFHGMLESRTTVLASGRCPKILLDDAGTVFEPTPQRTV
jgi:hypothetical protein